MKLDCKGYLEEIKQKAREVVNLSKEDIELFIFNKNKDEANQTYVNSKVRHCNDVGIKTFVINDSVIRGVDDYILPYSTNLCLVQKCENFKKELDDLYGFDDPTLIDVEYLRTNPHKVCTPAGIINLLKRKHNYSFEGKTAVIINRSDIVGKPLSTILLDENATVIVAHSKTPTEILKELCRKADIIFVGVGKVNFIDDTFLNNTGEQVLIDFGINRDEEGRLCGDINEEAIKDKVKYYTSTPGGTGLTTVAQLLENITNLKY